MTADPQTEAGRRIVATKNYHYPSCDGVECVCSLTPLVLEVEAQLEQAGPRCLGCGGPHQFDTSVPSLLWNEVIRSRGLPEFLCMTCIVREFVNARVSFTAELYGPSVNRPDTVPTITVLVDEVPITATLGDILADDRKELEAQLEQERAERAALVELTGFLRSVCASGERLSVQEEMRLGEQLSDLSQAVEALILREQAKGVKALRERIETEWYNGNMDEATRDALLSEPDKEAV